MVLVEYQGYGPSFWFFINVVLIQGRSSQGSDLREISSNDDRQIWLWTLKPVPEILVIGGKIFQPIAVLARDIE